jgi:hypothetical protein
MARRKVIFIVYLAYNRPHVVEKSIQRFRWNTQVDNLNFKEVIADPGYPLPDKEENKRDLIELASKMNCEYLPMPENWGQCRNVDYVNGALGLKKADIICYFDPDNNMDKSTWLLNAVALIQDEVADFVTADCVHNIEGKTVNIIDLQGQLSEHKGIWFKDITFRGGFPIGVYSGRMFGKYKMDNPWKYYGNCENRICEILEMNKQRGVMMRDHVDLRDLIDHDPEYSRWKSEVIQDPDQPSFEKWLQCRK